MFDIFGKSILKAVHGLKATLKLTFCIGEGR